jgi:molybdenum cofactor biosynthesis protein B
MSQIPGEHRATAPEKVVCAVVTVSDTRTPQTDTGGQEVCERLTAAGYELGAREIIRDEPLAMRELLARFRDDLAIDAVLLTGGTGVSSRDQTYETVTAMLTKPLPGYGELFRMLSFAEIGAAAMLSRATGGVMGKTVVLTMPGSPAAVRLAMEKLIVPELRHLVREARR